MSRNYKAAVTEAKQTKKSYEDFLEGLLDDESDARRERRVQKLIKSAKFPQKKYLEDFELEGYNKALTDEFAQLEDLSFIDNKENVILIGTPGSIVITTNLTFDKWEDLFKDPMLTGALIDRLAYKAHILDMTRETSHRFTETTKWRNKQLTLSVDEEKSTEEEPAMV